MKWVGRESYGVDKYLLSVNIPKQNLLLSVYKYFGKQKTIKTLTNAIYLHGKTLHFAAAFFKLEKSNFVCFINKQK